MNLAHKANYKEEERLKVLASYGILDTEPESSFDDLTLITSVICDSPLVALNLLDRDRVWAKSARGFKLNEVPRDKSLCQLAMDSSEVFEIPDVTVDERSRDSLLLTIYPNTRSYAGAPLIDPDGYFLGSLCIVREVAGNLSPEKRLALQALARQAVGQIVLRKLNGELSLALAAMKKANATIEAQEHEIIRTAKLATVGEMSASMTHEINNPLAILRATMDLLTAKRVFSESPFQDAGKYQNIINQNIDRIQNIVTNLRNFVKDVDASV